MRAFYFFCIFTVVDSHSSHTYFFSHPQSQFEGQYSSFCEHKLQNYKKNTSGGINIMQQVCTNVWLPSFPSTKELCQRSSRCKIQFSTRRSRHPVPRAGEGNRLVWGKLDSEMIQWVVMCECSVLCSDLRWKRSLQITAGLQHWRLFGKMMQGKVALISMIVYDRMSRETTGRPTSCFQWAAATVKSWITGTIDDDWSRRQVRGPECVNVCLN